MRNFHSRFGEIDIIALKENQLVFVEVKARNNSNFGLPQESITSRKRAAIIKTAHYYLLTHEKKSRNWQIDVIAISNSESKNPTIEHFENITL